MGTALPKNRTIWGISQKRLLSKPDIAFNIMSSLAVITENVNWVGWGNNATTEQNQ